MAKKVKYRYRSRPKRRRRSRKTNISIGMIGAGIASADAMGLFTAGEHLINGDLRGAADVVAAHVNARSMIEAAIPPMVVGIARKVVGPVPIFQGRRFRLTIF